MLHFYERFVLTNMNATPAVKQYDVREKILKTKYLFLNLLRMFRPGLILDVGSMDGSDSMRFRRMAPQSKIIAFEANPYNYAKMQSNPHLAQLNIEVRNRLVSSKAEKGKFYISKGAVAGKNSGNMGTSSSMMPVNTADVAEEIEVDTTRLDEIIAKESVPTDWVAMWIDVEGAGYEVLSSVAGTKQQIALLHIEVELAEFWLGQKLKNDVIQLANELGLVLLAGSDNDKQQDLVFVNAKLLNERASTIRIATFLAKWVGPASSRLLEKL